MITQTPLVSVLIITFNQENFIKQCIESVLEQIGQFDLEIVISNDCSEDNTHEMIEAAIASSKNKHKIKYFNQTINLGIVPNVLFGLKQCTGDYISICEGDDYWMNCQKLQKQLTILNNNKDCSMVITNRLVIREDGASYEELYDKFYKKGIFNTSDIINGFIPGTQTMIFRNSLGLRSFLHHHIDLKHCDRYIAYYASLHGNIILLPLVTAVYRLTGYGAWSKNSGLEKLQVKAEQLQDFHKRIGMPQDNIILAENMIACSFATLKYCLKRRQEWKKKKNQYWIKNIWNQFPFIRKTKVILKIILQN